MEPAMRTGRAVVLSAYSAWGFTTIPALADFEVAILEIRFCQLTAHLPGE